MKNIDRYPLLEQLIKQLTQDRNYTICIHDTSGLLHNNPYLALQPASYSHNNDFCTTAKLTSKGYKNCLRCKALTLKKAMNIKEQFMGECYMGQTEIVTPVYINDRLVCVIFFSNLISSKEKTEKRIKKIAPLVDINPKRLLDTLETMHEFKTEEIHAYYEMIDLISNFITLLNTKVPNTPFLQSDISPIFRGNIHSAVRTVADYISINYNLDLSLNQLAQVCFLNPEYLSKLFKKESGLSIVEYINFIRIQHAKDLLKMTEEDIITISLWVGYNSTSYFCRIFKRSTGLSPSEFREKNK